MILLHQEDEEEQGEAEEINEEEQEWDEIKAMLLEEFPPVEEETEEEESEDSAKERLEMEISQRFEKDDNNLISMMVMEAYFILKTILCSFHLLISMGRCYISEILQNCIHFVCF